MTLAGPHRFETQAEYNGPGHPVRRLLDWFTGSPSPNYTDTKPWIRTVEAVESNYWPFFPADRDARMIWPRGWKKAGVVAVHAAYWRDLQADADEGMVPGLAVHYQGDPGPEHEIEVHELPGGTDDMIEIALLGEPYLAVAKRLGTGSVRLAPVLFTPENQDLIVPDTTTLAGIATINFVNELPKAYGQIRVV